MGEKQEPLRWVGRCGEGAGGSGVCVSRGREGPCEKGETLLSPVARLGIALSLLVRELMQLSVLILESSFYSFPFFLPTSTPLQPFFPIPFGSNPHRGSQ